MKNTLCLLLLCCCAAAQNAKPVDRPIPPITEKEQLEFLKKHDKNLLNQEAERKTPQYAAAQASQNDQDAFVAKLFTDRHLTQQDAALCFGPGQGPCEGVAEMTLEFRPMPKPEPAPAEKKPEAKK